MSDTADKAEVLGTTFQSLMDHLAKKEQKNIATVIAVILNKDDSIEIVADNGAPIDLQLDLLSHTAHKLVEHRMGKAPE